MVESFDTIFPEEATRFLAVNGQREPVIEDGHEELGMMQIVEVYAP